MGSKRLFQAIHFQATYIVYAVIFLLAAYMFFAFGSSSAYAVREDFYASAQNDVNICACSIAASTIKIKNTGDVPSYISLIRDGEIREWSDIAPSKIELKIGEEKAVANFIKPPCNAEGIYELKTQLKSDFGLSKELIQKVNVRKCNNIDIISSTKYRTGCPCTPVEFVFGIMNPLGHMETYDISVEPRDSTVLSSNVLILGPGEAGRVYVFANRPCDQYGEFEYQLSVKARQSGFKAKIPFYLNINKCYGYSITTPSKAVFCSDFVNLLPITLRNTAGISNTFELNAEMGWKTYDAGSYTLPPNSVQKIRLPFSTTQDEGSYLLEITSKTARGKVPFASQTNVDVVQCDKAGRPIAKPGILPPAEKQEQQAEEKTGEEDEKEDDYTLLIASILFVFLLAALLLFLLFIFWPKPKPKITPFGEEDKYIYDKYIDIAKMPPPLKARVEEKAPEMRIKKEYIPTPEEKKFDMGALSLDELRRKLEEYKKEHLRKKEERKEEKKKEKAVSLGIGSYYESGFGDDLKALERKIADAKKAERRARKDEEKAMERAGIPPTLFAEPKKRLEWWRILIVVLIIVLLIGGLYVVGYTAVKEMKSIGAVQEAAQINATQPVQAEKAQPEEKEQLEEKEAAGEVAEEAVEKFYAKTWFKWLAGIVIACAVIVVILLVVILIARSLRKESQMRLDKFEKAEEKKAAKEIKDREEKEAFEKEEPFIKPRKKGVWRYLKWLLVIIVVLLLLGGIGYGVYKYKAAKAEKAGADEGIVAEEEGVEEEAAKEARAEEEADAGVEEDREAKEDEETEEAEEAEQKQPAEPTTLQVSDAMAIDSTGLGVKDGVVAVKKGDIADIPITIKNTGNETVYINLDMDSDWIKTDKDSLKIKPEKEKDTIFTVDTASADEGKYKIELEFADENNNILRTESFSFEITGAEGKGFWYYGKYILIGLAALAVLLLAGFGIYEIHKWRKSKKEKEPVHEEALLKIKKAEKKAELEKKEKAEKMAPIIKAEPSPARKRLKKSLLFVLALALIVAVVFGLVMYSKTHKISDLEDEEFGFVKTEEEIDLAEEEEGITEAPETPQIVEVGSIKTIIPLKFTNTNEIFAYKINIEKNVDWIEVPDSLAVAPLETIYMDLIINPEGVDEGHYNVDVGITSDNDEELFSKKILVDVNRHRFKNFMKLYWLYSIIGIIIFVLILIVMLSSGRHEKEKDSGFDEFGEFAGRKEEKIAEAAAKAKEEKPKKEVEKKMSKEKQKPAAKRKTKLQLR